MSVPVVMMDIISVLSTVDSVTHATTTVEPVLLHKDPLTVYPAMMDSTSLLMIQPVSDLVSNVTHAVEPVTVQLATSVFPVTLVPLFQKALLTEMTDIVNAHLDT